MNKKIAFKTLGCRLNQYETDALISKFSQHNFIIVPFESQADVYVINSCTVTANTDKKVRYYVNRVAKQKNSSKPLLLLAGCVNRDISSNPAIDYVVKNDKKAALFEILTSHFSKNENLLIENIANKNFDYSVVRHSTYTRGGLKIQDGCNNFCAFCIIPQVRGKAVSRPYDEVISNAKQLITNGFKEIVVTGVNIGQYSDKGKTFSALLADILELKGEFRVRISSIEPTNFPDSFYQLFHHPKLTPFLHLCLQSASDKILQSMRRSYTLKQYSTIVENLRKVNPEMNISTDIIVGFPGESEQDFKQTLAAVNSLKFAKVHAFRFSNRDKTLANKIQKQVPEHVKKIRNQKLLHMAENTLKAYRQKFIGKELSLLTERIFPNKYNGYSENYIPVKLTDKKDIIKNKFYRVKIKGMDEKFNLVG